ncbi:hypothetical protein IE53DRAFT_281451 [Violaceomyces palustris]|uniref:Uncharacterized protein n=1 Tax=Violaceomyces palustris TaxID=1673888 RepID=A0ACD0P304_9BASI|nr:hypothetical protein IE53DRAFT_281451 [Violaceomyces palustris]
MSQHWYLDRSSHPLPSLSQADDPIQHSTQQQYQNPVEGTEYQHSYRIAPSRSDEIYHRRSLSHNHSLEAGRRMKDDGLRNHGSGFQLASPSNAESPPSHASMSQSLSGNEAASSSMSSAQHLGQYSFGYHPSGRYLLPGLPRHARLSDHGQRANTPISHRSGREAHPLPLAMQPPPTAALRQKGRSSNQGHADKHWWSSRASPIDEARLGSTERRNPVNRTSGPHPANSFQIMTNYSSSQPGKDASHLQQDLGTQVGSPCNAQECVTGCVRDLPLRLGNELKTRNQRKRRAEIDDQAESAPPLRQNGGEVGRDGSDAEVSSQSEREGPSRGIQEKDQNGSKEGASGRTKRRKRAILSCTECKQRKIKCDRNVPNCSSCVRRGVAHLCKWGDERDTIANEKGSGISPSNAALMARIAQLEAQIRALQSAGRGAESDRLRAGEKAATPRSMTSSAEKEATSAIAGESVGSHFREESRSSSSPWYPQPGRTMEQPKLEDPNEEACSRPSWRMLKHPSELCSQSFRKDAPKDPYQSEESDAPDSGTDDAAVVFHALAKGHSLSKDQEREIRRVPLCDKGSIREKNSQGRPGGNVREPSTSTCQASNFPGTEIFLGDHLVARQTEQDNGSRGHPDSRDSSSGAAQTGSTPSNDAGIEEATHEEMIRILLGATNFPFAPIPDALDAFSSSKVDYMLKLLPSTEQVNQLVRFYIRVAEPMVNCLHVPLFFSQLESFWQVANERRAGGKVVASQGHAPANPVPKPMPDISFLALLFCMIAASCEYLTPKEIIAAGVCLQRSTISEKLTLYHHCVRALLSMVNVMWEPSLCTLQTIIIMRQYCFNRRKREEYISLQTMVLKAAEGLGLHRLGSAHDDEARWRDESLEAQKTSPDSSLRKMIRSTRHFKDGSETDSEEEEGLDPVRHDLNGMWLPKGSQRSNWDLNHTKRFEDGNRVARELGRKVWFALVTMDWMFAIQLNRCYYAREEMFTTELPLNLDDEDVWEGNELSKEGSPRSPGNHLVSQPVEVPTQNSFIRVQVEICYAVRGIVDALNRNEESYDHVLLLDSRLRSILDSLPKFFRLDGSSEYDPEILEHHRRRPYLSLQRVAIYETVHHRLLMLHRLFMGRGYLNPKYAFSTRTCIESARAVISSLKSLDQVNCYGRKYWLFK